MRPIVQLVPDEGTKILIPGDLHFPVHDEVAVDLMCRAAEDYGIDQVITIGDTLDMYAFSGFQKDAKRMVENGALQKEVDAARPFALWCSKRRLGWKYLQGNHENRLTHFINKNPGLLGSSFGLKSLLDDSFLKNCELYAHGTRICLNPGVVIEHGDDVKKSLQQNAASLILKDFPEQTTIIGHAHRVQSSHKTVWVEGMPVIRSAYIVGHMSNEFKQAYIDNPQWQLGFMIIHVFKDGGRQRRFEFIQVKMDRDRWGRPFFLFNGKVYR